MKRLREQIQQVLKTVTAKNSPNVFELIQTEAGYKIAEEAIIEMIIDYSLTPSAAVPHLEAEI